MGKKCSVTNCRSGYHKSDKKITIFSFPIKEQVLVEKWLNAIPRENLVPTKNNGVCELHFKEDDIVRERVDTNKNRSDKKCNNLSLVRLKSDAVPSIFPNCPAYFTKHLPPRRSGAATNESRMEKKQQIAKEQAKLYDERDKVSSLSELLNKLDRKILPDNVLEKTVDSGYLFYDLDFVTKPEILYCVHLTHDLKFKVFYKDNELLMSKFRDITKSHSSNISRCSHLVEIISFLHCKYSDSTTDKTDIISQFVSKFSQYIPSLDNDNQSKAFFILEQLTLLTKGNTNRRYSRDLIASATTWLLNSPSLYNQLRFEVLTLPVPNYVKRLTSAINVDLGLSKATETYLQARFSKIANERDKVVSVIIDEVFAQSGVEFVGGKFFGLENGAATKTLLCTMIKSIAGRYHDIVSLTPIVCIDSKTIHTVFIKLLEVVWKIGFDVVVTLVDGHSSNCKFFKDELCSGLMKLWIVNPLDSRNRIFLMFDPTHLFKNLYNNFINKKTFDCPDFDGKTLKPNIQHIRDVFQLEHGKNPKIAYRLSDKVLNPAAIEKTNVKLADSLFHESTIAALRTYALNDHQEFNETADFLSLIRKWWNFLNVKSTLTATEKRDPNREKLTMDNTDHLDFLVKFSSWLDEWEKSGKQGLSKPTFKSAKQTSDAMPEFVKYVLTEKKIDYLLTGNISSDMIEGRFGRYRRSAGTNYFISVRQLLEAEKAIRIRSLVSIDKFNLIEIQEVFSSISEARKSEVQDSAGVLIEHWHQEGLDIFDNSSEDVGIRYYCAGYISRSLVRKEKCQECKKMVIANDSSPNIDIIDEGERGDEMMSQKEAFLNSINRGGLCTPSDLVYLSTTYIFNFYNKIFKNVVLKSLILNFSEPRCSFVESFLLLICENTCMSDSFMKAKCKNGHEFGPFMREIAKRVFNICSKNVIAEENSKIHEGRKRKCNKKTSESSRKITKLQS